jgi:HPt (histidine-containing phosphotransfer) domain-containing protein
MTFDEEELLRNFSGYPELARAIVEQAIEALPARLDVLERAVVSGNWHEAQRVVHTTKGLAAQIGGMRLSKELEKAEQVLLDGGKIADTSVAELRQELALLIEALRKWGP